MRDLSTISRLVTGLLLEDDEKELASAAKEVERNPTDDQKKSGTYKKGHVRLWGFDISIENPKGGTRSGVDKGGKKWSVRMPSHYGYIKGTVGKDKDHIDVYIGDELECDTVYVVDQVDDKGKFDEHKCMLGFKSKEAAETVYDKAFSDKKGPDRRGAVTAMSMADFKKWLKSGNTNKPVDLK